MSSVGTILNREHWLLEAAQMLERLVFGTEDLKIPDYRVSVGWPSKGGLAKKRVIGQCWSGAAAVDERVNIFISPMLDDAVEVLGVLTHEMVHACVGTEAGHKGAFVEVAKKVGLVRPWTATTSGEDLMPYLTRISDDLGKYPHSALNPKMSPTKKQTTRQRKVWCDTCGYTLRATRVWLEVATPKCPNPGCDDYDMEMEVDLGD